VSRQQVGKASRGAPRRQPTTGDPILDAIKRCADAQDQLTRAQELSHKWEKHRRAAVRAAFAAGATTKDLADAVQVSRAKIYQLIGSARALKA
jgi:hypothetical protein